MGENVPFYGLRTHLLLGLFSFAVQWDYYSLIASAFVRVAHVQIGEDANPDSESQFILYGWVLASFAIAALVCAPVSGFLSDRLGTRPTLCGGLALMVTGNILYVLNLEHGAYLVVARVISGVGASTRVACLALIAKLNEGASRGEKIGQWYAFGILAMLLGPALGSALVLLDVKVSPLLIIDGGTAPALASCVIELVALVLILVLGVGYDSPPEVDANVGETRALLDPASESSSVNTGYGSDASDGSTNFTTGFNSEDESHAVTERVYRSSFKEHAGSARSSFRETGSARSSFRGSSFISNTGVDAGLAVDADGGRDGNLLPASTPGKMCPIPTGLYVLLLAQFALVFSISTFEALLVPLLTSRFGSSIAVVNLALAGVGILVLISSMLGALLQKKFGLSAGQVIVIGVVLFLGGAIFSGDYSALDPSAGVLILFEVLSMIGCACGFTLAFVSVSDLYATIIIASDETRLIGRIGILMAFLSNAASLARVAGPLVLGYGLTFGENIIVGVISGTLVTVLVSLLVGWRWVRIRAEK